MNKKDCFNLGHITKVSGLKGEVFFYLDVDDPGRYKKLDSVFVELNGQLVPFFIERLQLKKDHAVVKFEGIDTVERANDLVKKELYLPLTLLPPLKGTSFYFHEVIGFRVIDKNFGEVGIIEQVLDFPQQEILQVKRDEAEILIPVLKHIVKKVDRAARVIEVEVPEGLIELYMGSKEENPDDNDPEEQD